MKKRFSLKEQYKKSWDFIRDSKKFIWLIILIFLIFAFLGFVVPVPEAISEMILEFIQNLLEKTQGMSHFELTKFIFLNNLQSSFFGMLFGVFFGILPVLGAIVNGFLLGFVGLLSIKLSGIWVLWRLFPHGIFELPAIFISLGLGLRLGSYIFKRKKNSFKEEILNSLRVFLYVVLPLLIVAAIIEATLIFLTV